MSVGLASSPCDGAPNLEREFFEIAQGWDQARYAIQDEPAQLAALRELARRTEVLAQQFPNVARIRVWQGILLAGEADDSDWLAALRLANDSQRILLATEHEPLDRATTALLETALGALYAQTPQFPVAFGDRALAEAHLRRGLEADPAGLEPNYYYADFLYRQHRYDEAERALNNPWRRSRAPVAKLATTACVRRQWICLPKFGSGEGLDRKPKAPVLNAF